MSTTPNFMILWGDGINCENETARAVELAGGLATKVHVNELIQEPKRLLAHQGLIIPGGFSFGDHLGSGQLLSLKLEKFVKQELEVFVKNFPVLGICNGFQTLVRLGLLPDANFQRSCALIKNEQGHFQNAWVELESNKQSPCVWTTNLPENFVLPARHGEGRFVCASEDVLRSLQQRNQITLRYRHNFNGATDRVAGVCDSSGLVFALMPHPEAAVFDWQLPFEGKAWGVEFFKSALQVLKG